MLDERRQRKLNVLDGNSAPRTQNQRRLAIAANRQKRETAARKRAAKRAAITVPFSHDLKRALHARSQDVASEIRTASAEDVAEMCMDSIEFIHDKALGLRARDELRALSQTYRPDHILIEASRHVATW